MHHPELRDRDTFHKTRSGAAFSPWFEFAGAPLRAPLDFDIASRVRAAMEEADRKHEGGTGYESDEEEIPLSAPVATGERDRDRDCTDLSITQDEGQTPPHQLIHHGQASCREVPGPNPPSKEAFHAKMRSKARRRKARALSERAGEPGVTKRCVKGAALRRRTAAEVLIAQVALGSDPGPSVGSDFAAGMSVGSEPIRTDLSMAKDDVPITKGAFTAKRDGVQVADRRERTKAEMIAEREPRPILDRNGRVVGVLVGQPRDDKWVEVNAALESTFEIARDAFQRPASKRKPRRGAYAAATCGISYGGGQTHVRNMSLSAHNQTVLDALLRHQAVRRVANFGDAAFQLFAPRLHDYYDRTLTGLCTRDPSLRRNFERNVFANATFNLGPRTVAYKHRDNLNLPWGWCAITAIGSFNPHEGGIFRWVDCGYQAVKALPKMRGSEAERRGAERWKDGVEMMSMWSEFAPKDIV
ncbi:uncharacterized protein TRAVEDRAFT_54687 [Trametes versicolor FP-101664 SS1]|uniref:Uncharacterized protein n=1 Tax=Trametes versicolor (strain FP-101664) TaxID=717944 RepID=R7S657_TRAVS|nr:uncharacterized protein TRAVEDRAFT_54687 [Trametes versicolor FP-101664 SS1]EIW51293.1 hypothetical protein TRAVEDRAFT_54687 [Trametes versicolor FP-101664 SS1]